MNIGIVTTWFERGASYVSKQFETTLKQKHNIFIYARGGENYAIGDCKWDKENVTWGVIRKTPFSETIIEKNDFLRWLKQNDIAMVLFNEQRWWYPLLWCDELKIPTICYIDYYQKNTIPLFESYSALICNTKRHYSVFSKLKNTYYIPWGTDCNVFKPLSNNFKLINENYVTFFHSCGMDPYRKGTEIILVAAENISENYKLIIHTQIDLRSYFGEEINQIIKKLENSGKLEIIQKTVSAPGLFHLGDVYLYPSRLEGIGLTIAEAEACGLVPVVTNNAPMNEFIMDGTGYLIDVTNYFSREDGYYWPECTPEAESLENIMVKICQNKEKIEMLKEANYKFSQANLNWEINSNKILDIIEIIKYKPLDQTIKDKIIKYEESDLRRINKLILKNYWIISPLAKLIKLIT